MSVRRGLNTAELGDFIKKPLLWLYSNQDVFWMYERRMNMPSFPHQTILYAP